MSDEINVRASSSNRFARRFAKALRDLGILLGPATIVGLVCQMMNFSGWVTAEAAITVLLLTAVVFFASALNQRLHVAIPACVAVILAAALTHLALRPKAPPPEDPWVIWKNQIVKKVDDCKQETTVPEICIAQAISQEYPKPKSDLPSELLHNDLHAGTIVMTIDPVKNLLYKRIGVKDHFLGNGFAQPADKEEPYPLVPEYLAANLNETNNDVWTWALAPIPQHLQKKVSEIISSSQDTVEITGRDSKGFAAFANAVTANLDYERPAVIRFGRFPPERYSHKMGLNDAKRVFVLHLGSVYGLSLGEAARLSGYSLDSAKSDHDKLWVWVYLPSDKRDLVRPTWHEIIFNLKGWLTQ